MKGKKIIGTMLTAVFAAGIFTGVAFADPGKNRQKELKEQFKAEITVQREIYKDKINQEKENFKVEQDKIKAQYQDKKAQYKQQQKEVKNELKVKGQKIKKDINKLRKDMKKFAYDKMELKKDIFALKERFNQMNKPLTFQQGIVLTVKEMGYGYDLDAQARMNDQLDTRFKFAPWATGYVSEAVYKGLVTIDELNAFNPNKPLNRTGLAILLVRAKGVAVDTAAYLNVKDVALVPVADAAYVATALEKGWMAPSKVNAFMPFKPVTRSEFAAAFAKAGFDTANIAPKYYETYGTLKSVNTSPAAITLTVKGADIAYAVYGGASITIDGKAAALADLKAGMNVKVRIADNVAVAIKAASITTTTTQQ